MAYSTTSVTKSNPKFEVKVKRVRIDGKMEPCLNRLGSMGWEVVAATEGNGPRELLIILKKRVD